MIRTITFEVTDTEMAALALAIANGVEDLSLEAREAFVSGTDPNDLQIKRDRAFFANILGKRLIRAWQREAA